MPSFEILADVFTSLSLESIWQDMEYELSCDLLGSCMLHQFAFFGRVNVRAHQANFLSVCASNKELLHCDTYLIYLDSENNNMRMFSGVLH